jgi:hypothetical protein
MNEETYLNLLSRLTPLIKMQGMIMREAATPHERLPATLWFLTTGRSYEDLKYSTSTKAAKASASSSELDIFQVQTGPYSSVLVTSGGEGILCVLVQKD